MVYPSSSISSQRYTSEYVDHVYIVKSTKFDNYYEICWQKYMSAESLYTIFYKEYTQAYIYINYTETSANSFINNLSECYPFIYKYLSKYYDKYNIPFISNYSYHIVTHQGTQPSYGSSFGDFISMYAQSCNSSLNSNGKYMYTLCSRSIQAFDDMETTYREGGMEIYSNPYIKFYTRTDNTRVINRSTTFNNISNIGTTFGTLNANINL